MIPINEEKIKSIVSMARENREGSLAMVSEELSEPHNSDRYTEHSLAGIVEEYKSEEHAKDSAYNELKTAIDTLNEEERYGLVALMWVGRGTYSADEFERAMKEAKSADNHHTAEYLIDTPLLPDYLEEGLVQVSNS